MAQRAHVPKFGNWEIENIPYTTYFENAQKDRGTGTKMFNPNDPEENPEAFTSGIFTTEHEPTSDNSCEYGLVKRQNRKYGNRENGELHQQDMESLEPNKPFHQRAIMGSPARSKNPKSGYSGSGSDKSTSDSSIRSLHHRKGSFESPSSPLPQSKMKPGKSPRHDKSHDVPSSVPRFGAWDENDPKSGEGFTIIFNKVKQQKQITAKTLPTVPSEEMINANRHEQRKHSSSKLRCCFCPAVNE